jgi:mannose-6-phosphate isomerase-like protein (cupin superfamily)
MMEKRVLARRPPIDAMRRRHLLKSDKRRSNLQKTAELVERITYAGRMLALVISGRFREPGIHFFTPDDFSQQLAYMEHPAGKLIAPHVHNPVPREVQYTQEVLFIRKGHLRVDFYDHHHCYLRSRILEAGDVILLIEGGHGFEVLEDVEMIEVKQGPYAGEQDKTRFKGVSRAEVSLTPGMAQSGE